MGEIALDAFGKINLALDVLYKREDGYHEINTIMQQIDLKDRIIIKDKKSGITMQCNDKSLPLDSTNLVYKAWEKIVSKTGINKGVHIIIEKNIPLASGLAGGSSNGAVVLKGLNQLWDLKLTEKELMDIGLELGTDVPFCILGGTAWGRGKGEKLTRLKSFANKLILLANVGIPVSTAYVYSRFKLNHNQKKVPVKELARYMEIGDLPKVGESMENVMEKMVIKEYPIIEKIKNTMLEHGALGSIMSGSGPTVFGLFSDEAKLLKCKYDLQKTINKIYIAKTL